MLGKHGKIATYFVDPEMARRCISRTPQTKSLMAPPRELPAVRMYFICTVARQKSASTSIQNLPRATLENQYIAAFGH